MKNRNLNMLVRACAASRRLSTGFFCFFIVLSTILILLVVSIFLPLRDNIENKINNHISNRELTVDFAENIPDDFIDGKISEIRKIEHISDVYLRPVNLTVSEQSGILADEHKLGFLHRDFTPIITSGRAFDEAETGVAIVPQNIRDFNLADSKIYDIAGEDLIGKTLVLKDECGNILKAKVVGVYSASDPIFSGDEILIPQADLLKYDDAVIKNSQGIASVTGGKSYIILIDSAQNSEKAMEEASKITNVYRTPVNIDSDSYNIALIILIAALVFFVALVIVGLFMFLKNNIDSRTNELALYRSLGYKSKHLFYIVFAEHLFFGILSLVLGVIITALLARFLVNPYLYGLVGGTIMEITVSITAVDVICLLLSFIVILVIVCRRAVKRSEKIDLTVLLREK